MRSPTPQSPPAPVVPLDSRAAAEAALADADTEHRALADRLLALEHHRGAALLEEGPLGGVTRLRWREVHEERAGAFADLEAHRRAVDAARARCAGRGLLTRARRREVVALLAGPAGARTADGDPIARPELAARVRTAAGSLRALFDQVVAVSDALDPLLEALDADLRRAETALARFDGSLRTDPCRGPRARLDALRGTVARDPLAALVDGRPDRTAADALRADVDGADRRLAELGAVRRGAAERLEALGRRVATVDGLERREAVLRAEVALKIVAPGADPPPAARAAALETDLARARRLLAASSWEALATALPALEEAARRGEADARDAVERRRGPLRTRDALRGQLEAYRAKARDAGLGDDEDLGRLHGRAHDLLWHWPCDLAAAHRAGETYTEQVNAHVRGDHA